MIISYTGKERCDIMYYLSVIANKNSKKVLFIDNSMNGDLHITLTKSNNEEMISTERCMYLRKYNVPQEKANEYDIVLLYNGLYTPPEPYELKPDFNIVCVSANRIELEKTRKALIDSGFDKIPAFLVIADVVSNKLSELTICEALKQEVTDVVSFDADPEIWRRYEFFSWEGKMDSRKLPESYRQILEILIEAIFKIDRKMLKKLKF